MGTVAQELLVQVRADTRDLQTFSTGIGKANETIKLFARESSAGLDAITKRITQLTQGAQQEGTRADSLRRLVAIEEQLQKALARGNLTFDQRIRIEQQLTRTTDAIRTATAGLVPAIQKGSSAIDDFAKGGAAAFSQFGGAATSAFANVGALLTSPLGALGAAGVVFAAVAVQATKMAAAVEGSLIRVAAAVPTGTRGLDELRARLKDLSEETGTSQQDLAAAAATAARTGAESAEAAGQRVEAALTASIATGEDLQGIIGSLDQVLDVFGKSSGGAADALGKLFAATRGKASLSETLAILQAAAPGINRLGLDIDTATRALVALGEKGLSVKAAGAELNKLAGLGKDGAASIRALAADVGPLTSGFEKMKAAADLVNNSAEGLAKQLRADLSNTLIELGNRLLPTAIGALQDLLKLFDGGKDKKLFENDVVVVTAFGRAIVDAADASNAFKGKVREQEHAIRDMAKAVREGTGSLKDLSRVQLTDLSATLVAMSKARVLSPEAKADIKEMLGAIEKIKLAQLNEAPTPGATGAAGATGKGVRTSDQIDADQKAAKTTKERADAVRDLGQAIEQLGTRAKAGDISLTDFDASVRELADKATKLQLPITDFADFAVKMSEFRRSLVQVKTDDAARELRKLQASFTTTTIDDEIASLEDFRAELVKQQTHTQAEIDQTVEMKRVWDEAKKSIADLDKQIAAISSSGLPALKQSSALQDLRNKLENQRNLLIAAGGRGSEQVLAIETAILHIDEAQDKLGQQNVEHTRKAAENAASLARTLENVTGAAFGLATALLGADSVITKMLGGVQQIASGFQNVAELARNVQGHGGFGELFSTGAGIASALPGIGAIIGGAASVISLLGKGGAQESSEAKALRESLQKNSDRLVELRAGIEKLTLSLTGAETAAVRDVPLTQKGRASPRPDAEVTTILRPVENVLRDLRKAGVSLEELRKVASDFGITLSEKPTIAQLKQLQEAIKTFSLDKLLNTLDGQLRLLEVKARIDPAAFEGIKGVIAQIAVFSRDGNQGIPAIGKALKGLNLETDTGKLQAIQKLKDLLANIGSIDLADFGGIDPDQLPEIIAKLIEGIVNATPKVKTAGEQFAEAMDVLGVTFEFSSADAATRLKKITETFRKLFPELADSIDFSSVDAFDASLQKIIEGFAADGELSAAEQAQIAALRALRDAFKAAVPEAKKFIDTLDLLTAQFDIFETSKLDQFNAVSKALGDKFGQIGQINELLQLSGLDASTEEGRRALRSMLEGLFKAVSADGIAETEQPLIDAIRQMLRGLGDVADEEAAANEKRIAAAAAKRKEIRDQAERDIDVKDISDPLEQFKIRFAAAVASIPGLAEALGDLDVATEAGRQALDEFIADLITHPEKLAAVAEQLGIPLEELISVFLGLESGSDAVNEALQRLADGAKTFADRVNEALSEIDFQIDLHNITDPLEKLKATIAGLAALDPRIAQAVAGFDLTSEAARKSVESVLTALAASSTDPVLRQEILAILHALRAIPAPGGGAGEPSAPGAGEGGTATTLQGTPQITVQQADRLTDLGRSQLVQLAAIRKAVEALLGVSLGSLASTANGAITTLRQSLPAALAPIRPPALPQAIAVHGDLNVTIPIAVHAVFNGLSKDERKAADLTVAMIIQALGDRKLQAALDRILAIMAQQKALNAGNTARS